MSSQARQRPPGRPCTSRHRLLTHGSFEAAREGRPKTTAAHSAPQAVRVPHSAAIAPDPDFHHRVSAKPRKTHQLRRLPRD